MTEKRNETYKEALAEIEGIISEIESESIDVDLLAAKVKRAAGLIKFCKEKLAKTEAEVSDILEEFEKESDRLRDSGESPEKKPANA